MGCVCRLPSVAGRALWTWGVGICLLGVGLAQPATGQTHLAGEIDPPGAAKPLLTLDSGGHTNAVYKLMATAYGDQLISVSLDKTIRFWDLTTGQPLRVLHPPVGPSVHGYLYAAAISPDGHRLAVAGYRAQTPLYDHRIHLISLPEGRMVHSLKGHTYGIYDLAFSPDGKQLASGGHDGTVRIWSVESGEPVRTLAGHTNIVHGVAWSPDGKRLLSGAFDATARIWLVDQGTTEAVLSGHSGMINTVAWSPDGRSLATGGTDRTIHLWEPSGKQRYVWHNLRNEVLSVAFAPESMRLLYTFGSNSNPPVGAAILELKDGRESAHYQNHANSPICGIFLGDGKRVATGDSASGIRLWDAATGATLRSLDGRGRPVVSAGWSPDGQALAWGHSTKDATIDRGGALERTFCLGRLAFGPPPNLAFSRAKPRLGAEQVGIVEKSGQLDRQTVGFARSGVVQRQFKLPQPYDQVRCYTMLGNHRAAIGTNMGSYLVDANTGLVQHELMDRGGEVLGMAPTADLRYLLTAGNDQVLNVWQVESGELLLSFFPAGGDWIAWTTQGYYAASLAGETLMGWHVNDGPEQMANYYSAAQFHKSMYRPDVIRRVLEMGNVYRAVELADRSREVASRRLVIADVLPPKVRLTEPGESVVETEDSQLEVQATAEPAEGHPLSQLRLIVDGRPRGAPEPAAADAPDGPMQGRWQVDLPPGKHSIVVKAETADSYALSPAVEVVRSGAEPAAGKLFVLAIGAGTQSSSAGDSADAANARAVAKAFEAAGGSRFDQVIVRLLADRQATSAAIEEQWAKLRGEMTPADTAVIYYAGAVAADAQGELRLASGGNASDKSVTESSVPGSSASVSTAQNTTAAAAIPAGTIAGKDWQAPLGQIAGHLMLVLDVHAFEKDSSRRETTGGFCGAMVDDDGTHLEQALAEFQRTLLTEDYGVAVVSTLRGTAAAGTTPVAGKPAAAARSASPLAQALGEALGGKADANADGTVEVGELGTYVTPRVRSLTSDQLTPTVEKPRGVPSFPLGSTIPPPATDP